MINDKNNFDWKKYIIECLDSTVYCVLGTLGVDGVWTCPVNFAYDKNFNFYFISQSSAKHAKNIQVNSRISVAIFNGAQDPQGEKKGIQLTGKAKMLEDYEIEEAFKTYFNRYGKKGKDIKNHKGPEAKWKFFKVTPVNIYYFDTEFFGEKRQEVPRDKLR